MKLVLDIGGSAIKYATMSEDGIIHERGETPTPLDQLDHLLSTMQMIYQKFQDIDGIAISMPGNLDSDRGDIISGGALLYNAGVNFYEACKTIFSVPVHIENDGKCAALAESWKGNLQDCHDGIVLVLGTGIGGGIVKDGNVHKGKHFFAGEFSFMMCNIHNFDFHDCAAVHLATAGLVNKIAMAKNLPMDKMDGKKVFALLAEQDKIALQIFDDYTKDLAIFMYNLQCIYDPERILLGGGISKQPLLLETIRAQIAKLKRKIPIPMPDIQVDVTKYFNDSNLLGALRAYQLWQEQI